MTHNDHNAGDGRTRMDDLCKLVGGQGSLQSESESTYSGIQGSAVKIQRTYNIKIALDGHYIGSDITMDETLH